MKKLLLISLLMSPLVSCSRSGDIKPNFREDVIRNEISSIIDSINYCLENEEYNKFTNFFNKDSLSVIRDGKYSRDGAEWLVWWQERASRRFANIDSVKKLDYHIHVLSSTSAVYTGSYSEIIEIVDRGATKVTGAWTCVFQNFDGVWKIVSLHISH